MLVISAVAMTVLYLGLGAVFHALAITRWPWLTPFAGNPKSEFWNTVLFLALPAITVEVVGFLIALVAAPSQIHFELQNKLDRLTDRANALELRFDPETEREVNERWCLYRIVVANRLAERIGPVSARIAELVPRDSSDLAKAKQLQGVTLHLRHDNKDPHRLGFELPPFGKQDIDVVETFGQLLHVWHAHGYAGPGERTGHPRPYYPANVLPPGTYELLIRVECLEPWCLIEETFIANLTADGALTFDRKTD